MTRQQALEVARTNEKARMAEYIVELRRDPSNTNLDAFDAKCFEKYGYRHGWYLIAGHSFNGEDITGVPYDLHQGGWAYL